VDNAKKRETNPVLSLAFLGIMGICIPGSGHRRRVGIVGRGLKSPLKPLHFPDGESEAKQDSAGPLANIMFAKENSLFAETEAGAGPVFRATVRCKRSPTAVLHIKLGRRP
jgi:hypothetical protein